MAQKFILDFTPKNMSDYVKELKENAQNADKIREITDSMDKDAQISKKIESLKTKNETVKNYKSKIAELGKDIAILENELISLNVAKYVDSEVLKKEKEKKKKNKESK